VLVLLYLPVLVLFTASSSGVIAGADVAVAAVGRWSRYLHNNDPSCSDLS
jgi:hypothetical protein